MCQSCPRRARNMLRLALLLALLTHHSPAYVTDTSFADRLDKLYEKLEKLTVAPQVEHSEDSLLAKIDKLNAIGPRELTDEDEELLSAMQIWGTLNADQLEDLVKELQGLREIRNEEMTDGEYPDSEWNEDSPLQFQELNGSDSDYAMDEDDEEADVESSTAKPSVVTPSAFTKQEIKLGSKLDNKLDLELKEVESAVDSLAATKERPRILDDSILTAHEKADLRIAAVAHMRTVLRSSKCLTPQPRWLSVSELAPAADIKYMPPCVQLHRCAPGAGCCMNESLECAAVDGNYVNMPFYLKKADDTYPVVRMQFFNHTRCACVSRDTLQSTIRTRTESRHTTAFRRESVVREAKEGGTREPREQIERQNDWRSTEEPKLERDEEPTAPPQMRRCTCPGLFMAKMSDSGICACVCEWSDLNKRRDCLSLSRGREHFGLRDRVCVINGDCNHPTCEYGAYERGHGRCPQRRFRRLRFHRGRIDKIMV